MMIVTGEQRRAVLPPDAPPFSVRPGRSADRRVPQYTVWNHEHACAATDPVLSRATALKFMDRLNNAWRRRRGVGPAVRATINPI